MLRRTLPVFFAVVLALALSGCRANKRVQNPIANLGTKQPDKVLFDRAMDAMKHNRFDVARLTLQTLINTYPDSEFIARAKLAVGDSWYAEGGSAALAQAENEYRDFETFFPNMPEAAEAQLKIANIHYRQMEKPDRDFTHAMRAEEEYRQLMLQYPDSKLVAEAKERLREVQEVLAEREFRVGRFYFMRESYAAAIARLRSVADSYPLYSGADEVLYMLGNAYEKQVDAIRAAKFNEVAKGNAIKHFADQAAEAYSRILTRYPEMARAEDAKKRLEALHRPVPAPTPEAIAQNKAEVASRQEPGMFSRFMSNLHKRPDTSMTAKVGEPTLTDPKQTGAPDVVKDVNTAIFTAVAEAAGTSTVTAETAKAGTGAPPASQPTPRSDNPPAGSAPAATDSTVGADAIPELKPLPDSTSAPAATQAPPPAPPQINEAPAAQPPDSAKPAAEAPKTAQSDKAKTKDEDVSTSSKKKKKGLRKLVPF